ncbi:Nitrilase/cyanide hydratase and apolipoprotein N-acyltransferase [Moelleriella libera RCEF 2490]|uniref:Nitrilase/cyanide hydratase and apolipoprotein N-acyltransferase n=1 Tax=Moelleriella libera RCEF 2490 TaxID=1081109 RepID=A0A168EQB3_9HYPO|nr:Nitrilase/cyanide hydratase and apolipoprotein N-acyltransferase [Moelleriella libera RCEF 2490]
MSSAVLRQPVQLACVQLASGPDKAANLAHAAAQVARAAAGGSKIVVLPECFNSPYGCQFFPEYAEPLPAVAAGGDAAAAAATEGKGETQEELSPSYAALSAMAARNKVYLIGGSIPEVAATSSSSSGSGSGGGGGGGDAKTYYNTSLIFGPDGTLLGAHRKIHLFDIDIPGKITFRESDVLSPGHQITLVDLPEYGTVAVAICYDVRFPELAAVAARRGGAFALVYPGAFNLTTGPLHWELLARARAVDNQLYVAMCSPARDMAAAYHAWGHSLVVDPMAKVLVEAGEAETIVEARLDGAAIDEARRNIPLSTQRRFDVYPDVSRG